MSAIEIVLEVSPEFRESVTVAARRAEEPPGPSQVVLTSAAVQRVAGAGDNVFHALQTLPGVSATEDWGSRLSVRGGGPDQNLTVMDGVEIHNPYRLFGITSAFNPEITDRFELTAGGFGAKYGDRLSSLLLVDNRQGTTTRRLAVVGDLVVHRHECRRRRQIARAGERVLARHRTAHVLRPHRRTHREDGFPWLSGRAGEGRLGSQTGTSADAVHVEQS